MNYQGLTFINEGSKKVVIDVEGYIGFNPWDSPADKITTKEKMKAELKKLASLKVDEIQVNINSYGGDVNHGISIHDLLVESKAKVITRINGMTASSATIIAMAGDERQMSDNALFLVHNASTFAMGDKNDIQTSVNDLKVIDDRIANIYAKRTGKDKQEMLDLMNEEKGMGKWMTADEAKTLGFVTDVFEPMQAAAFFSNDVLNQFRLPEISKEMQDKIENQNLTIKNKTMNKPDLKILASAAGLETLEVNDGGVFLNSDNAEAAQAYISALQEKEKSFSGLEEGESIQGLRDKITAKETEAANLAAEKQTLADEKAALEVANATLTAENETLSKQTVDPTGANADGDNTDPITIDAEAQHFFELSKVQ